MGSFQEEVGSIRQDSVDAVVGENAFTIWSYFLDPATPMVGIFGANQERLGVFYLRNDGELVLMDPHGLVALKETRILINKTQRTFEVDFPSRGAFMELVVFDDTSKMGASEAEADPVLLEEMDRTLAKWSTWIPTAYHRNRAVDWLADQADKLL